MFSSKIYFLFSLFLISSLTLYGQNPAVKVTDFGDLYSTFNEDELKTGLTGKFTGAKLAFILANSNENGWPSGITSLDGRNANRPKMYEYRLYQVATFDNDTYALLLAPANENQHMPAEMRPEHDIYFVLSAKSVEKTGSNQPVVTQADTSEDYEETGDEEEAVTINDPGQLMSTYNLAGDSKAKALLMDEGELTEEEFVYVSNLCKESSWPAGIRSFENRQRVQEQIKKYHARFAANFIDDNGKDVTIIHIPYGENQHMPAEMRPDEKDELYMVFLTIGLEYNKDNAAQDSADDDFEYSYDIDETEDFNSQLNFIVEAAHNNFDDLMGDKIANKEGEISFGEKYHSNISLEKSAESYISDQLLSDDRTFIAVYGEYKDQAQAKTDYKYLADYIDEMDFYCCTFVKNESNLENVQTTYWLPFNIEGDLPASLENVLIEVQLTKTFDIDENLKMTDTWLLVLRVSKQQE